MATDSLKLFTKIATKPLRMKTWLLLTAYRKLPTLYPMVPSQLLYDLPISHNTAQLT